MCRKMHKTGDSYLNIFLRVLNDTIRAIKDFTLVTGACLYVQYKM